MRVELCSHDEIVAHSGFSFYGADHFIDRLGARKWRVTIPGVYGPHTFPQRQTARREVNHIIHQIDYRGLA